MTERLETSSPESVELGPPGAGHAAAYARRAGAWQRLRLNPTLSFLVLGLFVIAAIVAPLLTPHDPVDNDLINSLIPPAWTEEGTSTNLLGTDTLRARRADAPALRRARLAPRGGLLAAHRGGDRERGRDLVGLRRRPHGRRS